VKFFTFRGLAFRPGAGLLASGLALLAACSYTKERIPEPTCTSLPAVVSYQQDVLPILKARCYRCHSAANYNNPSPNGSAGALNMESFAALKTWTQPTGNGVSYIVGSIRQLPGYNPMPFDGKDGPDACQIATIKAWVDAGAPAN
jgi:hypothetical protein